MSKKKHEHKKNDRTDIKPLNGNDKGVSLTFTKNGTISMTIASSR